MKLRCEGISSLILAGIVYVGCLTPAVAQNPTCPTRPVGDSTNACASTAFVNQNANILNGTAGYHLTGNGVGTPATFQGFTADLANAATRTWQSKVRETISFTDITGVVADNTTDVSAAVNAAIAELAANGGGALYVTPAGTDTCYRIASPIIMKPLVVLYGGGDRSSCILADDTDALSFDFVQAFGQSVVQGVFLKGANATAARTAVSRPGSNDLADIHFGALFDGVLIYDFDTAFDVGTVRNWWITNSWAQNVNHCALIRGFSAVVRIQGLQCVVASGGPGGGSATYGIKTEQITYVPEGAIGPEGIQVNMSQIFGFETPFLYDYLIFGTITNSDVLATRDGIKFTNIQGGLYIQNNYIEINGVSGASGIYGVGLAAPLANQTVIQNNTIIASGSPVAASCVQINEVGTTNQFNVSLEANRCSNFTDKDFLIYNAGSTNIERNILASSGVSDSIYIGTINSGIVNVQWNVATTTITRQTASDVTNGFIRLCNNISGGTTRDPCTWTVTINDSQSLTNKVVNNIILSNLGASTATFAIGSAKTATISNTLTFNGTDGSTVAFGAGGTVAYTTGTINTVKVQTFCPSGCSTTIAGGATGTYTPSTGMITAEMECVGGGGGGGSAQGSAGNVYSGAGGGSGSYCRKLSTAASIGASRVVSIGAGGAGGASGSNAGSAGGASSVGSLCTTNGGAGGDYSSVALAPSVAAGGAAGTGDVAARGNPGGPGLNSSVLSIVFPSGSGGSSYFGGGAPGVNTASATAGGAGGNYGSGGSGANTYDTASAAAGGAGSAGYCIIREYTNQ